MSLRTLIIIRICIIMILYIHQTPAMIHSVLDRLLYHNDYYYLNNFLALLPVHSRE